MTSLLSRTSKRSPLICSADLAHLRLIRLLAGENPTSVYPDKKFPNPKQTVPRITRDPNDQFYVNGSPVEAKDVERIMAELKSRYPEYRISDETRKRYNVEVKPTTIKEALNHDRS